MYYNFFLLLNKTSPVSQPCTCNALTTRIGCSSPRAWMQCWNKQLIFSLIDLPWAPWNPRDPAKAKACLLGGLGPISCSLWILQSVLNLPLSCPLCLSLCLCTSVPVCFLFCVSVPCSCVFVCLALSLGACVYVSLLGLGGHLVLTQRSLLSCPENRSSQMGILLWLFGLPQLR